MDVAWRVRIMIFSAMALMIFGDIFGYGGMMRGVKSDPNQQTAGAGKFQQKNAEIVISEDADLTEFSAAALQQKRLKFKLTDGLKDACLPKMLCEMASKPEYLLTEKEKDLMSVIRSSSTFLAMHGAPSRWHFAAHMGELMRYTGDELSGSMGCATLWPNCPISSKNLNKITYKVKL